MPWASLALRMPWAGPQQRSLAILAAGPGWQQVVEPTDPSTPRGTSRWDLCPVTEALSSGPGVGTRQSEPQGGPWPVQWWANVGMRVSVAGSAARGCPARSPGGRVELARGGGHP